MFNLVKLKNTVYAEKGMRSIDVIDVIDVIVVAIVVAAALTNFDSDGRDTHPSLTN